MGHREQICFSLEIGERPDWVMATIDTCMIQKFVPRARQIHKFPFDDKEFCPLARGLQCFTRNGEKLLFLACFSFQDSEAANIGRNKSIHIDHI